MLRNAKRLGFIDPEIIRGLGQSPGKASCAPKGVLFG